MKFLRRKIDYIKTVQDSFNEVVFGESGKPIRRRSDSEDLVVGAMKLKISILELGFVPLKIVEGKEIMFPGVTLLGQTFRSDVVLHEFLPEDLIFFKEEEERLTHCAHLEEVFEGQKGQYHPPGLFL